jgi:hypothetical protein
MPENDQVQVDHRLKQLESILAFYANASPQALLADAGGKAISYFATKNPSIQVYLKVNEIKKRWSDPHPDQDVQFLLSVVEVQRRSLGLLMEAIDSLPNLSLLEHKRIQAAQEDITDLCEGLIKPLGKKKAKSEKK